VCFSHKYEHKLVSNGSSSKMRKTNFSKFWTVLAILIRLESRVEGKFMLFELAKFLPNIEFGPSVLYQVGNVVVPPTTVSLPSYENDVNVG
jgi:hypothetical protein